VRNNECERRRYLYTACTLTQTQAGRNMHRLTYVLWNGIGKFYSDFNMGVCAKEREERKNMLR
jgi:hypothetical protein